MTIKHSIKQIALSFGIELNRYNPAQSQEARMLRLLTHHGIDTIIDVGANNGGYGRFLRKIGYKGAIISFEPLQNPYDELMRESSRDPAWHVAPRMALGEEDRAVEINIAGNSTSSSILSMHELHEQVAPQSEYIGSEHVNMRRLDGIKHQSIEDGVNMLLKIDTQGYEMSVLLGAENLVEKVKGIQLELSLVTLYEGQKLYMDMLEWLESKGFELWNMIPGFMDPNSGRMLQMDGIFFRKDDK